MDFHVRHRFARTSARKARYIADLIRGKALNEALECTMFVHRRAKVMVEKALKSGISNANEYLNRIKNSPDRYKHVDLKRVDELLADGVENHLFVKEAFVDGGPILKRWLPRAMGRATPILKRTCHITIILSDEKGRKKH